jgi:galactokinase
MERGAALIDYRYLKTEFINLYGPGEPRLFRAPGRVNLIGEHTDYNDGFVLPMAIEQETAVAASARADRLVRVYSLNMQQAFEFDLDSPGKPRRGIWLDYVEGVARALINRGVPLVGADMVIESDVPVGAGLSSSAALEMSTGFALWKLAGGEVDLVQLALAGQEAEHTYVGAMVGIMDQLTSATAEESHALLIDCRELTSRQIPLDTSSVSIVICDSRVKHSLASSEYNTRRRECEEGVSILKTVLPGIKALRDVTVEEFHKYERLLDEPVRRRVRHVVTEIARTLEAAEALSTNDYLRMGQLMYESHESLKNDYEVSSPELDLLVGLASTVKGVFGARMTGGGFGGCTVNLVKKDRVPEFQSFISREYLAGTGKNAGIYVTSAKSGVSEVKLST